MLHRNFNQPQIIHVLKIRKEKKKSFGRWILHFGWILSFCDFGMLLSSGCLIGRYMCLSNVETLSSFFALLGTFIKITGK